MKQFLVISFLFLAFGLSGQLNMDLVANIQYEAGEEGNDVWGYTDSDGTEYAIMGTNAGVYIYNLTDPSTPDLVQFIPQQFSTWRDMKTWKDYAYVVADEGGTTDGILAINLNNLPGPITWENLNPTVPLEGSLNRCHNLYIDQGFAYLSGCFSNAGRIHNGAVLIFDVDTNLGDPIYVGNCPEKYSHDVYVRDNIVYSSEINEGVLAIYDATDPLNVVQLAAQGTPFSFTHNAWLSDDGQVVFTTDEKSNAPVAAYDISDLANIRILDSYKPLSTIGQGVIPHNVHVWDDYLIISYYTDGVKVVDASRPGNLIEVGNYDTYLEGPIGFQGVWGAFPFFDSGLIILGDIDSGFYVMSPDYIRACYLEGLVTDAGTGSPLVNAEVEIIELSNSEFSKFDGIYRTGHGVPGTYTVRVSAASYISQSREVQLENGVLTLEDFQLERLPTINLGGLVTDAETGLPLEDAAVSIVRDGVPSFILSDAGGQFSTAGVLAGDFDIIIGKWGYKTQILDPMQFDGSDPSPRVNVALERGYEDIFSINLGWETAFNGVRGQWERVKPIGHKIETFDVYAAPPDDSEEDEGDRAYITGQSGEKTFGLLLGESELVSPPFDVRDMEEPVVRFDFWYWATTEFGDLLDTEIAMTISNGTDSLVLESISYDDLEPIDWRHSPAYTFKDQIELTDSMTFKFVAANDDPSVIVEAGIDNFRIVELATVATESAINSTFLNVYPNPSSGAFHVAIDTDQTLVLDVYDQNGLRKESRKRLGSNHTADIGAGFSPGVYFLVVRNSAGEIVATDRLVKL